MMIRKTVKIRWLETTHKSGETEKVKKISLLLIIVSVLGLVGCTKEQSDNKVETPEIKAESEVIENETEVAESERKVLYASNYAIFSMLNVLTDGLEDTYEVRMIATPETEISSMQMTDELKAELAKADTIVFMDCEDEHWLTESLGAGEVVGVRAVDIGSLIAERDKVITDVEQEVAGEVRAGSYDLISADASEKILDPQNIKYIVDVLSVIISATDDSCKEKMQQNMEAYVKELEPCITKMLSFKSAAEQKMIVVDNTKLRYLAEKYRFETVTFEEVASELKDKTKVYCFTKEEFESLKDNEKAEPVRMYDTVSPSEALIDGDVELLDMIKTNTNCMDEALIQRGIEVEK